MAAHHEAAGVRSLVLAMSHPELIASGPPPAHATAPRPAQSPLVSREVCVGSGCSGSLASLMEGFQQIATTTGLLQHSSQAFSVGLVGHARQ